MRRRPRRFPEVPQGPLAPRLTRDQVIGCPVESSLGLFGRKWALLIIRDLVFYPGITFGQLLRQSPRMTPRVLSMRLRELREAGLVEKLVDRVDDRVFHYRLTAKGMDSVPVMTALSAYGLKHLAQRVFKDGRPRELAEVFPGQAEALLGELRRFAFTGQEARTNATHPG
jgi:DNA-binding HxlR family transcriptional regulator